MPRVTLLGAGRLIAIEGPICRGASERLMIGGRGNELVRVGSDRTMGEDRDGIELLGTSNRLVAIGVGAENVRGCTCDGAGLRGGLELPREDRSRAASSPAPRASSARTAA